jgi:intracellular septation protein
MTSDSLNPSPKKNRPILEYGPLILFFIANYFAGIMWGTGVLVIATVIALSLSWLWDRKIPMMALFGGIAVAFFGGLTIFFNDPVFIKIKPTVISLLIAAVLAGGQLIGRNPLKAMLSGQLKLSSVGWQQVTWIWVVMFVVSAGANEIAWRTLSDDGWVTFKAFGLTGISMLFALLTIPIMKKHGDLG